MKVAIIGTQGVPAHYGGFESLVENIIGENASKDVEYTIFCSSKDMKPQIPEYKGCQLKYVPLHANGMQSIPYDMISMMRCVGKGFDVVLVLGVSGCLFLPVFRCLFRKRLIVNIDGLEHRRAKWGKTARRILRWSEAMALRYADAVIADNKGIQDYVTETYRKPSVLIAYGGDHVIRPVRADVMQAVLDKYGLQSNDYAFTVCRIEPENNCHLTLQAFAESGRKLMFVGNFDHSDYARQLRTQYDKYPNIIIAGSIYNLDTLYALRANCRWYIHGHSAGGTNPSLVEAMHFGRTILAFDVVYNRATTYNKALYWKSVEELKVLIEDEKLDCGAEMLALAQEHYVWKKIAQQYEETYQ